MRCARRTAGADDLVFVTQPTQLGTGHAVRQAVPHLDDAGPTLVLYGDVPLTTAATLRQLVAAAGSGVALLTVRLADPSGYGRIVRDAGGSVVRIVEEKDATAAERAIDEINTGILVAPTAQLKTWLASLSNRNAQGEYYLTDVDRAGGRRRACPSRPSYSRTPTRRSASTARRSWPKSSASRSGARRQR